MRQISPWRIHNPGEVADAEYSHSPESEEVHLRDYWRMLVKRRRLVVLVFLVVVGLGTYLTFSATPLYTASATLEIGPQDPTVIQLKELLTTIAQGSPVDTYYETQHALLKNRPLAARVISDLGLESDPAFTTDHPNLLDRTCSLLFDLIDSVLTRVSVLVRPPPTETQKPSPPEEFAFGVHPDLIGRYLSFLQVNPVKDTQLVQVVFTTPDPHLSQKLANAHAAAFIRSTLETRFELTAEAREFLQQKRAELQAKVQQAEEALQRFRQEHGVVSLEGNENIVVDRMVDLNKRLTEARAKRIDLESLYRTVENKNSRYLSEIIDNTVIQQLKTSLLALEAEQARLSATFTPAHPRLMELNEQIGEARRRLDREIVNVVRKIESDYDAARAREEALQAEAEHQQQAALNLKEVGVEYTVLKAEVDSGRAVHESVLKRLNETNISNNIPVSNIQFRERAETPRSPSSPQTQRNLVLAVGCGLFLGSGLAFFLEYMDSSIGTPEDAWRATAVPTLGVVPHTKFLHNRVYGYGRLPKHSPVNGLSHPWTATGHSLAQELMVAHHPHSILSESYRIIRTALLFADVEHPPQVILLTSAHPGEGKTVTTLNLAISLAQSGSSVVVVDADLRKGRCHRLLGRQNHRGLSQVLIGCLTLEESVQETPVAGLSFISRGTIVPNPPDLLASSKMKEVVEALRERFDFVLLDSTPTIAVSDATILSQLSDGVLLVIHGQRTTTERARRVVERLEAVHARILGVVLNSVDIRHPAYADYRHYYTSYYAATREEAEE